MARFSFRTKLEDDDVVVYLDYEHDEEGVYNSEVVKVMYMGIDVLPILSEETLYELDSIGNHKMDAKDD